MTEIAVRQLLDTVSIDLPGRLVELTENQAIHLAKTLNAHFARRYRDQVIGDVPPMLA